MNVSRVLSVRAVLVAAVLSLPSQALAQTVGTALVRHAPSINSGTVEGSVQQLLPESVTLNGGVVVTGDLLVPGTPTVRLNGKPTYAGTLDGTGSASPSSHQVTLNGNVALRHVVRRTGAVALPVVSAPPAPSGTRTVTINASSQSAGDFGTLRHLTLNGSAGQLVIPPGTYGDFTANGGSGFTLGVAGGTTPVVYNFQRLTLNGQTQVQVVGPVIINVANGLSANGTLGSAAMPSRLTLNVASGGLTLNGGCNVYGYVNAPNGAVTLNGNSQLVGGVACDALGMEGGGLLRLIERAGANQPPHVAFASPAHGATFTAPASLTLVAVATDADDAVAKVEFFLVAAKLGEDTAAPYEQHVTGLAAGAYTFFAKATDSWGAATDAAPVTITVTTGIPNQPPSVALTAPTPGISLPANTPLLLSATAIDSDGTIAGVEFFSGTTRLGAGAFSAPASYALSWSSGFPAGIYGITAKATDNTGATASSSVVTIKVLAKLPYVADFEATEGYILGTLTGQQGWDVTSGTATIASDSFFSGSRAVIMAPGASLTQVSQSLAPLPGESIVFAELFAKPVADVDLAGATRFDLDSARFAWLRNGGNGELQAFSGEGGGTWNPTSFVTAINAEGVTKQWIRVTVRLDFTAKRWDLYAGGALVAFDLGFSDVTRAFFGSVTFRGNAITASHFDYLFVGPTNPLFVDLDRDGMDDAWETINGLNPAVNDRNGDADGDSLSNVREFQLGTRANFADTDGDGLPDGWEVRYSFNPLVNDAAGDADGDGVSNLDEFLLGRNPRRGVLPDSGGTINLRLYSPRNN